MNKVKDIQDLVTKSEEELTEILGNAKFGNLLYNFIQKEMPAAASNIR